MQTGCTYRQAFTFTVAIAHCLIECLSHTPSIIMQQASEKIALTVNGIFFPFILHCSMVSSSCPTDSPFLTEPDSFAATENNSAISGLR